MDNSHRKHGKYQMVNKTKNCQRKGTIQKQRLDEEKTKQRLDEEKTICSSNMHYGPFFHPHFAHPNMPKKNLII